MAVAAAVAALAIAVTETLGVTPPHPWWTFVPAVLLLLIGWRKRRPSLGFLAVALFFVSLHGDRLTQTRDHPLRERLLVEDSTVAAFATGTLLPEQGTGPSSAAVLEAAQLKFRHRADSDFDGPLKVRAILPDGTPVEPGIYECSGRLFLPSPPSLPSEFDRRTQLWRDGYVAVLRIETLKQTGEISWVAGKRQSALHWAHACREWIASQLTLDLDPESDQAAVLRGMVLGNPGESGSDVEAKFRNSGTMHLFAVSGLHVGLIAVVGWSLLRWLPLHRTTNRILLIAMVFAYAFVTGWRPSAARAAWMIALMLAAGLIGRRSNLLNSLGTAAVVLLAMDTHQLFRPGFQLSFGVLIAILVCVPWMMEKLKPWVEMDPFLPRQLASRNQLAGEWVRRQGSGVVAVSVAAWLGSLPLMLWHFQAIAPIGLMANCLLVPLAFFPLFTSCLSLCASAMHLGGVQIILNNANWFFASVILHFAGVFSEAPGARWTVRQEPDHGAAEGVFFDIRDRGAAAWMRVGSNHWLWDTGPRREFQFVVQPYLAERGVGRLDGLFLSHNDTDHIGGASQAIARFRPIVIYHGLHEPWRYDVRSTVLPSLLEQPELGRIARPLGTHDRLDLGMTADGPAHVEVLYPGSQNTFDRADDRALVARVQVGDWRILWLPDHGFTAAKDLIETHADLTADVCFHTVHASDPGCLPEMLRRVNPSLVISTSSRHLPGDQIPDRWLEACASRGIPHWNTREAGAVRWILEEDGGLSLEAARTGNALRLDDANR
jgi:ComEC/Rec2-related protein